MEKDLVNDFKEKPAGNSNWVNGGYFVLEPPVFDHIKNDFTIWEREPLEKLTKSGQLSAYKHRGFWYAIDTLRDKKHMEELWNSGKAPWKIW